MTTYTSLRMKRLFYMAVGVIVTFFTTNAQQWTRLYDYRFFDSSNSPFGQSSHSVVEDKKGYIWVGTENGIVRFDGVNFKTFEQYPEVGQSYILDLELDQRTGNLIVVTEKSGIYVFDGNNKPYPFSKDSAIYSISAFNTFFRNDTLLVASLNGLYLITPDTARNIDLFQGKNTYAIEYNKGYYYVTGATGVVKTNFRGYTRQVFAREQAKVIATQQEYANIIWFNTLSGVYKLENDIATKVYHYPDNNQANHRGALAVDTRGTVFFGTTSIFKMEPGKPIAEVMDKTLYENNIAFRDIYIDKRRTLWLTSSMGLVKVFSQPASANPRYILDGDDGYFKYDKETDKVFYIKKDKGICSIDNSGEKTTVLPMKKSDLLQLQWVNDVYYNKQTNTAYLLTELGFFKANAHQMKAIQFYGYRQSYVRSLVTSRNEVLIGSRFGLALLKADSLVAVPMKTEECKSTVFQMQEDMYGNTWCGAANGLYYYDRNAVQLYNHIAGISKMVIMSLAVYKNYLAIIKPNAGISIYKTGPNGKLETYKQVTLKEGLLGNNPYMIHFDEKGYLYASFGNYGYSIIKPDKYEEVRSVGEKTFTLYPLKDLMFHIMYGDNQLMMLYGGGRCLKLHTEELFADKGADFNVVLNNIRLYSQQVNWADEGFKLMHDNVPEKLILDYKNNFLSFDYSAIYTAEHERMVYRHKLEGTGGHWIDAGTQTSATYNNLIPGSYSFEVQASTDGKQWTVSYSYPFTILPPWWQTWWFRLGLFAGISIVAALLIRMRIREFKQREMLKRVALENEMKALRSQINPHFIQNTFQIISNRMQQYTPGQIIPFLKKTSDYFRAVLLNSEVNQTTLEDELAFTQKYISFQQELITGLEYRIEVDDEVDTFGIMVPSMLLQPFVENAIKYGFSGISYKPVIQIKINITDTHVVLSIKDNGKGVDLDTLHVKQTSKGNKITTQRLNLFYKDKKHSSKISFKSAPGEGFEVVLQIPVL